VEIRTERAIVMRGVLARSEKNTRRRASVSTYQSFVESEKVILRCSPTLSVRALCAEAM
jgi:hypothetical protein